MSRRRIAILGGTGALGSGLAGRLARAGHHIVIGSRDPVRAVQKAGELGNGISGASYVDAAAACDIAILTVPFASQAEVLAAVKDALTGKILVDATVPLVPPKVSTVQLPPQHSAALTAQTLLGPEVTVVSAFQNVGALHLQHGDAAIDCDVLVSGNGAEARAQVIALVEDCGLRGWHAGPLANAVAAEALTSVMIFINRHYKTDRAGLRITGADKAAPPSTGGLTLFAPPDIPEVVAGDDPAQLIVAALERAHHPLVSGDVVVIAQKIVSKAEGRSVELAAVMPSAEAKKLAAEADKDPRQVELVLREARSVLRARPGVIVVEHVRGWVLANAGIDRSNVPARGHVLLLPQDPDTSAQAIRAGLQRRTGAEVAVIIADSIGRAWRLGTIGTAIGASGVTCLADLRGRPDLYGHPLETTEVGHADELAAAASVVMGQAGEGRPVVVIRGVPGVPAAGRAADLIRPPEKDLFR